MDNESDRPGRYALERWLLLMLLLRTMDTSASDRVRPTPPASIAPRAVSMSTRRAMRTTTAVRERATELASSLVPRVLVFSGWAVGTPRAV